MTTPLTPEEHQRLVNLKLRAAEALLQMSTDAATDRRWEAQFAYSRAASLILSMNAESNDVRPDLREEKSAPRT